MACPFIILASPRSGSTFVHDMLNSHPNVRVYGELFLSRPPRERPLWEPNDLEFARVFVARHPPWARSYWAIRYLQRVFDQPTQRAAGLKLMYEQVRVWPETLLYAAVRRVRVIHLVRHNLLDIVLSERVRQKTGLWHITNDGRPPLPGGTPPPPGLKIRLEPEELVNSLTRLARNQRFFRTWLASTRAPALEVGYEQLVGEPERFAGTLEFLGLPPNDWRLLRTGLEKINTRTHGELIENISEVQARLSRTHFADLLRA